ncbi:MAG: proline dehydrogenase family protein [Ignavibacteriae bacterium]|nr:proline dehydrogenase family protein [Ignavibacteriota bacterium]
MSFLNTLIAKSLPLVPKSIVGQVSKRYIAGSTVHEAVNVVRDLNAKHMLATVDILGEDVYSESEAVAIKDEWLNVLSTIREASIDSNCSLKLSQLGLRIDSELCYRNLEAIVSAARKAGNFVRIDMEDSSTTSDTIAQYRRLREAGYDNVGVVIQAYLRRSEEDIRALAKLKANIRLCKGIYVEPEDIAFRDRYAIRRNFVLLLRTLFESGCYVGIATHDDYIIEKAYELIERSKLAREQYEFQMLLGVREQLRDSIVARGHRLRVYVPFGQAWYAYSVRRLNENPQIAGYIVKAMFGLNNS